nr:acyltransferase [Adlercreutzia equolifaciens]
MADYVFCGPSCVFTNDLTPRAKYPKGSAAYRRTPVGEGASIGANATIVCGHEIGSWALIGAGAVVVTDVLAHALMLGVPAKRKGWVCECGQLLGQDLVCGECGRMYCETDNGLKEVNA